MLLTMLGLSLASWNRDPIPQGGEAPRRGGLLIRHSLESSV
jgi:hypothetical protein